MRLLLDTNIFVYMVNEPDRLTDDVRALLEDPEYMKYLSTESIRELIVAYRSKGLLSDVWHSEREMVDDIYNSWMWTVDAVDHGVLRQMADLRINSAQKHNDPSDHIIIAQAIAHRMTLISSDGKFPFYRAQGLELVENR